MTIYEASYNPMVEESAFMTISLHKTRGGADKAIRAHKRAIKKEELKLRSLCDLKTLTTKWHTFKSWMVFESELLD